RAVLVGRGDLREPTEQLAVHGDLRERHHPGALGELHASDGILAQVHLRELRAVGGENALHTPAERAWLRCIDDDFPHYFIKYSAARERKHDRANRSAARSSVTPR